MFICSVKKNLIFMSVFSQQSINQPMHSYLPYHKKEEEKSIIIIIIIISLSFIISVIIIFIIIITIIKV